ncbi:MAG: response regulator transcription factor [Planctomycetota bacterium]|nr:response regulator transcription factor [Planctomycetota bacterium]
MSVRVVIADDHEVVRKGLVAVFENSEIEIVGEAANGIEAVEQAAAARPDVLLLDVRMPDGDGLDVMIRLQADLPETKIVLFSNYDNPTYIARAVALGAFDYVLKGSKPDQVLETVRRAATADAAGPGSLLDQIRSVMAIRQNQRDDIPLTHRETQVLRHIAFGLNNREIGLSLRISVETVKEHVQNILRKVDASDRTQAAIWAFRQQLVE